MSLGIEGLGVLIAIFPKFGAGTGEIVDDMAAQYQEVCSA